MEKDQGQKTKGILRKNWTMQERSKRILETEKLIGERRAEKRKKLLPWDKDADRARFTI